MSSPQRLTILLCLLCILLPFPTIEASPSDTDIKCGSCPCGNSCGQQLPLPSPPPPSPPPPSSPPFSYLSSQNCDQPPPPPPSPRFIYVTGEPGNGNGNGIVYQPQPYSWGGYYNAGKSRDVGLLILAGLVTMVIWVTSL